MSSIFKSILKIAPIALPFIFPGIGSALGAALGASGAGASALGSGLLGAGAGALSGGGLKSALLGGATGGLGGYLSGGGFGLPTGSTLDSVSGIAGAQGPTLGSGLVGSVTQSAPGLSGLVGSGASGLTGASGGGSLSTLFSGINELNTQDDIEQQLAEQQQRAEGIMNPFLSTGAKANQQLSDRLTAGFDPSSIESDPSYQFRKKEGQNALNTSLAAQGMSKSGAALRAAQDLGQEQASQEYDSAYNRWLQQNQQLGGSSGQGFNAAGGLADIYGNQGNIGANASAAKSNVISSTLSDLLRGSGNIVGWDRNGKPIYGNA